jgi:hypothetical protein
MGFIWLKSFLCRLNRSNFSTFFHFNSDRTVLVGQTRSQNMSLPDIGLLPVTPTIPVSVESVPSMPDVSDIVSPTSALPEPDVSFSSKLTGAGLLLLREHRRLGHLHDRVLKRMIDGGMCGNLVWVPGIVLRAHCWDCLKGQQKSTTASFLCAWQTGSC